jgi:amidase/6-aminohexanoate-cyclic-dimer hydrolase
MSGFSDYESHDAIGLADLVKSGDVSPDELLDAAIARAEERNPTLNAIVVELYDQARSAIAAGLPDGPFRGVPFLLKDLYTYYAGAPVTNGCKFFEGYVADHDSELVARYKKAGLVIFGRTASPEFGLTATTESRLHGNTLNPWHYEHTAGGSSGGAASAVAAGIVPAAHASDGGGSIRIPASCCGLFGLKPTRARVPMGPDVGEGWSGLSTLHAITRSVRDSAALLDASAGPEVGDPYWAPPPSRAFLQEVGAKPGQLRIALVTRSFNGAETHSDCVAAVENAARLCADLGHRVEDAALSVDAEALGEATEVIAGANLVATLAERGRVLGREYTADDVEPINFVTAKGIEAVGAGQYAAAIRAVHATGRRVGRFFEDFDVLLTPTMAAPPMKLGQLALTQPDVGAYLENLKKTIGYTQLLNVAGNPAMSVPLFWNAQGLPIGLQFAGRFGDEATLFRLAAQLEQARPWAERRPG